MKTRNPKIIAMVKSILDLREEAKVLALKEAYAREQILAYMGANRLLEANGYTVSIEARQNNVLDRKAIMHDLGEDFFDKYNRRTSYDAMLVKKAEDKKRVG